MSDASRGSVVFEGRQVRMSGPVADLNLLRAEVDEGLSMLTDIDLQFLSSDHDINLDDILGRLITLEIDDGDDEPRYFQGHCINVWYEGVYEGLGLYRAELRPWLWFLTQTSDCRIFQELSAIEIIKKIFNDHGFSDFKDSTRGGGSAKRPFCVQYNESDYDFICRLMEEEGIYFFFEHDSSKDTLVLIDDIASHDDIPFTAENSQSGANEAGKIEFFFKDEDYRRRQDHIFKWQSRGAVLPGKVTYRDYDFEASTADLTSLSTIEKGTHNRKSYELYEYPGTYKTTSEGEDLARIKMESKAAHHMTARGVCNVRVIGAGQKFTLLNHPRNLENREYLVTRTRHQLQIETDYDAEEQTGSIFGPSSGIEDEHNPDTYRCIFEVQTTDNPYRAPHVTKWPKIDSLQTAIVVGPDGEEIYTDEHGRVKVQFHWDREGQKNENSTCFIRVAQPWSGKNYGMAAVPRIGQEVIVQFEEGNPDRPIITGMLYNDQTKHPYDLPGNKTQTGIKTRSTKQGTADTFNEFVFEDLKDSEFVRLQSEKDYFEIIKNNAEILIGFEKMDPGDLFMKVYANQTEEVETGDKNLDIKAGSQIEHIATDRTVTIDSNDTLDVGADKTDTIGANYTIDVGDTLSITAGTKIELIVGGSSITIQSGEIKIETSGNITLEASGNVKNSAGGNFEASAGGSAKMKAGGQAEMSAGGMGKVAAGGVLTVQGSLVKIN